MPVLYYYFGERKKTHFGLKTCRKKKVQTLLNDKHQSDVQGYFN